MKTAVQYFVLLAIAAGLTWYYSASREQEEAKERSDRLSLRVFPRGEEEDNAVLRDAVAEVRLTPRGSSVEIVLARDPSPEEGSATGSWRITAPRATGADNSTVDSLVSTLVGLQLAGPVEDNVFTDVSSGELANFGLEAAVLRVGLRYDGEASVQTLLVGDQDPTGSFMFGMIEGDDEVLVLQNRDAALNRSLHDLRDKQILRIDQEEAVALSLSDASGEIVYRAERADPEAPWRLSVPVEDDADPAEINSTLSMISNVRATDFLAEDVTPEQIAGRGLASPEYSFTVVTAEGTGRVTRRLLIGRERDSERPAMLENGTAIVSITVDALSAALENPDRLRSKIVTEIDPEEITALRYERRGRTWTWLPASPEEGWTLVDPPPSHSSEEAAEPLRNLTDSLRLLRAREVIPEDETDDLAALGLDPPEITMTVSLEGQDEPVVLELGSEIERSGTQGRAIRRSGRSAVLFLEQWRGDNLALDLDALGLGDTADESGPLTAADPSPEPGVEAPGEAPADQASSPEAAAPASPEIE
ncbi:MAG: DUF4340 domain-containing protein [Candidatus Sumerlaeia bacterium]|nr:DUF4340 domain-containing protein [Candidatus Sumerlaeia bacterium]